MKSYQAYASGAKSVTRNTPQEAAVAFFEENPKKRKCDIIEGVHGDGFFTVAYGQRSKGEWPKSWKNVTKKDAHSATFFG